MRLTLHDRRHQPTEFRERGADDVDLFVFGFMPIHDGAIIRLGETESQKAVPGLDREEDRKVSVPKPRDLPPPIVVAFSGLQRLELELVPPIGRVARAVIVGLAQEPSRLRLVRTTIHEPEETEVVTSYIPCKS